MSFCNNLLPSYQNLCPKYTQWLRHDAGAPFGGLEGSTEYSRIYDFSFLPVNHTFETVLLLQKQYVMQI